MNTVTELTDIITEASVPSIPTYKTSTVYHVGNLSSKRTFDRATGMEGDGLPVSEHPTAWRKIARLGGASLWMLHKSNGVFLDALALMNRKNDMKKVLDWASKEGYITPSKNWKVFFYDDDSGDVAYFLFDDEKKAIEEYEDRKDAEDEYAKIEEIKTSEPTEKMHAWFKKSMNGKVDKIQPIMFEDMVVYLYAQKNTQLDGVWWKETYMPQSYSAPRGSIFQNKLASWKKDEIDWSQASEEEED